jgi:hypothetical protein
MKGARDNFRMDLPYDLYVEMDFDGNKRLGKLINICTQGAAIGLKERDRVPQEDAEIRLMLLLPESSETLELPARVVWAKKAKNVEQSHEIDMGIQYKNLDKSLHEKIWGFIVDNTSAPHSLPQ